MANPMQALRYLVTAAWHRNSNEDVVTDMKDVTDHLTVVGSGSKWFGNKKIYIWHGASDATPSNLEKIRVSVATNHIEKNHYVLECVISVVAYCSFLLLGMSLVGVGASVAFLPVAGVFLGSMVGAWIISSLVGHYFEISECIDAIKQLDEAGKRDLLGMRSRLCEATQAGSQEPKVEVALSSGDEVPGIMQAAASVAISQLHQKDKEADRKQEQKISVIDSEEAVFCNHSLSALSICHLARMLQNSGTLFPHPT